MLRLALSSSFSAWVPEEVIDGMTIPAYVDLVVFACRKSVDTTRTRNCQSYICALIILTVGQKNDDKNGKRLHDLSDDSLAERVW